MRHLHVVIELSYGGQLLDRQSTLEKYVPVERKRATMYLVQLHEISAHGDKDGMPAAILRVNHQV